jgi:hypothetical protein
MLTIDEYGRPTLPNDFYTSPYSATTVVSEFELNELLRYHMDGVSTEMGIWILCHRQITSSEFVVSLYNENY